MHFKLDESLIKTSLAPIHIPGSLPYTLDSCIEVKRWVKLRELMKTEEVIVMGTPGSELDLFNRITENSKILMENVN